MKIREANPGFKKFEASEEDFSKESIESSRNFLISLIKEDEESLKFIREKFPNVKELIIYSIKLLLCYDLKIKPDCIKVEYEDEDSDSIGSKSLMAWGTVSRNAQQHGIFGYLLIYPVMQKSDDIMLFMATLLHEFRHIYQDVQRERGHIVPPFVNLKDETNNAIDSLWLFLRYCANFCEFDADMYSIRMIEKWLKEGNAKKYLSEKEYDKKKSFVNKRRALTITTFTLGNFNKASAGVMLLPYLVPKYIIDHTKYKLPRSSNFDIVDENNLWNEKRGYRNKEKAQKYLRRSRVDRKLSESEKLRIIDSMLVVFAEKHNIPPRDFGLLRGSDRNNFAFEFIDAKTTGEDVKTFGYICLREESLFYDGVEFFDRMVENFEILEGDVGFKMALNNRNANIENNKSVEEIAQGE